MLRQTRLSGLTRVSALLMALAGAGVSAGAQSHQHPAGAQRHAQPAASVYAPYKFLIGEWSVGAEGGAPMAIERFRWGGTEAYIWFSIAMVDNGAEQPHLEGMLMWNGVRKNLDMLLAADLTTGRMQEQGVVSVHPDGTVVREITAYYAEGVQALGLPAPVGAAGATARFRQTFKAIGPDKVLTTVMRETRDGWVPTFPGGERLIMTRRSAG